MAKRAAITAIDYGQQFILTKPIKRVIIEVIPHLTQRYETAGDWFRSLDGRHPDPTSDTLYIKASKIDDSIDPQNLMALAVAYHELGEALACLANSIDESVVDAWDKEFKGAGEPGEHPKAPYRDQHATADICERLLVRAMGYSWRVYDRAVKRLFSPKRGNTSNG